MTTKALYDAACVIAKTEHIRKYLQEQDPKALEQIDDAILHTVLRVKIDLKYNSASGEYCVRWIEDGIRVESKCYYTDGHQDAIDTWKAMAAEANKQGYVVIS